MSVEEKVFTIGRSFGDYTLRRHTFMYRTSPPFNEESVAGAESGSTRRPDGLIKAAKSAMAAGYEIRFVKDPRDGGPLKMNSMCSLHPEDKEYVREELGLEES